MTGAPETRSDCTRCVGLCCVALPFARSADFPVDKAAGVPCGHLGATDSGVRTDHGGLRTDRGGLRTDACGIHADLLARGYRGCTVFECFGAGQQVTQVTFGGRSWRDSPATATAMFAVFPLVHGLHEMLRHLDEALGWHLPSALASQAADLRREIVALTAGTPETLLALDLGSLRARVGPVLGAASATVRGGRADLDPRLRPRADLSGADLRRVDATGADLRGALLLGADLRHAVLARCDLLGADLRGTRLDGADLATALFLTEPQVAAARGDATTTLPTGLERPRTWT